KGYNPNERVVFTEQTRDTLQGSLLFADISSSFPNYRSIQYLKDKNVIAGYEDGTFRPDQVVSRAEALKLIFEATNTPSRTAASIPFKDVKSTDWFVNYVMTGYLNNVVQGYTADNTFRPNNTVNKTEFLKMLLLAMKIDVNMNFAGFIYDDVSSNDWFASYVAYAKNKNLVPVSGNNFNPNEGMKRKDVAEVIYRVMVIKDMGADKYSDGLATAQ
ncbi:MAG: S-layer homology domain-containing protein, partial [Candidatus Gracilibacteria bacterium]